VRVVVQEPGAPVAREERPGLYYLLMGLQLIALLAG
jgi:hypothetical protein